MLQVVSVVGKERYYRRVRAHQKLDLREFQYRFPRGAQKNVAKNTEKILHLQDADMSSLQTKFVVSLPYLRLIFQETMQMDVGMMI